MYLYWMVPTVGYRTRSTLFVVRGTNLEPKNIVYFVISIEHETNLLLKPLRGDLLSIPKQEGGFPLPEPQEHRALVAPE